jgi:hypothetical protein
MALEALSTSMPPKDTGWMLLGSDDTAHAWRTIGTRDERAAPCRLSCRLNTCHTAHHATLTPSHPQNNLPDVEDLGKHFTSIFAAVNMSADTAGNATQLLPDCAELVPGCAP